MTKSQTGTVKRPMNVPVHHFFDKKSQIQSQNFRTRKWETVDYVSVGWIRRVWGRFTGWLGGWFGYGGDCIDALDLREKNPRGHGAAWLRQTFSQNLKMISTRDGKPV